MIAETYLSQVFKSGQWGGDGLFSRDCEDELRKIVGERCLLMPSATAALETMMLILDLKPGDEVIMPSFTFPSCANAVVLRGATPVFVDIRLDTLNIDETQIEAAITAKTRAIMVVHYAGVCCDMTTIWEICLRYKIPLLEDAAQALLSTYKGRPAGILGTMGAISFHQTKNISCGEGGAFFGSAFLEQAEIVREKGTDRSRMLRGEIDKYTWRDVGSSYLMSEFQAAVLLDQLERAKWITSHRIALWEAYAQYLPEELEVPTIPDHCGMNGHIFWTRISADIRGAVIAKLRAKDVAASSHFEPLHLSPAGRRYGRVSGALDVTETAVAEILRLPLGQVMTLLDVRKNCAVLKGVLNAL